MRKVCYFLSVALLLMSCGKDDTKAPVTFGKGLIISNEGVFNNGTGTLSLLSDSGRVKNELFKQQNNGQILGNIVQSIGYYRDHYYIVVNNASRVVVTDLNFKYTGEITGIDNPRYIKFYGDQAYISYWGLNNEHGGVAVVNVNDYKLRSYLELGAGSEEMAIIGDTLLVANGGAYNPVDYTPIPDSTVSIITLKNNSVAGSFTVGTNPNSIAVDGNRLYIACAGKSFANGSVWTKLRSQPTVAKMTFEGLDPAAFSFSKLIYAKEVGLMLLANSDAYAFKVKSGNVLGDGKVVMSGAYRMYFRASNGHIYLTLPLDYSSPGKLVELSTDFKMVSEHTVGIIPGFILESAD
ncbi:MAG TPA: hypothetical protein PLP06_01455 [Saprospiraceae bacterium]|nr:hypothetical protein [Saprospiraceae bacterium]